MVNALLELVEFEWTIIARGRQTEAVVDEVLLPALVAVPHAVDLGNGGVAFINEEEKVAGEVVEKGGRGLAGETAAEVAGVVLDAVAVAHGLDHLEIEAGALVDALGLDHAAFGFKLGDPFIELFEDGVDGLSLALGLDYIVALGVDGQA